MPESAELTEGLGPTSCSTKSHPWGPCQDLSQNFQASENSWFLLTGEGRAVPGFILPRSSPTSNFTYCLSFFSILFLFPFWFLQMQ